MEQSSEISEAVLAYQDKVDGLYVYNEEETSSQWQERVAPLSEELLKELEALEGDYSDSEKAFILFLRGRLINLKPDYSEEAEKLLDESIALNPKSVPALLERGETSFRRSDFDEAKSFYMKAQEAAGKPNKAVLQRLSMVTRRVGQGKADPDETLQKCTESVNFAKKAVALDVKDGDSWFHLGTSHLAKYVVACTSSPAKDLQFCLKAFSQAEKTVYGETKADLHNNRGQVHRFLENYESAIVDYSLSLAIDPEYEEPKEALDEIADAHATIERKGNLKAKKLKQMIAKLPSLSPSKPTLDVSPAKGINQLSVGVNKGASAVVIIIGFIGNPVVVPLIAVVMDAEGSCCACSCYSMEDDILQFGDVLTIKDPTVKQITLNETSYNTIVVEQPLQMLLNGRKINVRKAIPGVDV